MNLVDQANISDSCRPIPKVNRVQPINVPVYDLPEYLCVETEWVSRQYAMDNNITADRTVNGGHTEVLQKLQERAYTAASKKSQNEDLPRRERCVQTEAKSTVDVGVQCCRHEEDWAWDEPKNPEKDPKESASEEAAFLTFVSDKTSMFPNGMLECQVCGEVAYSLQEHQGHMKVHYGTTAVLCYRCGHRIAHEKLMRRHNRSCSALPPRKSIRIFNCPHPLCSFKCHSERQLFRHLAKHNDRSSYRCLQCQRNFKTASALLIHRKAVSDCSKAKCLILFRNHQLAKERGDRDLRCCSVCLERFSSERKCNTHRRKCVQGYIKGLSRALLKEL